MIEDLRDADPAAVGPYRLLGRLGAGGMGQVYLARSPGGRLVAIKLVRAELAAEHGFRARFASEIAAARHVSGIYTPAVVDADAAADLPWMATVYVPGPSLADAVAENGPLPPASVLALAAGLAEALAAIHRAGLVHRDLKPSNVLLAADGPRVIDFGISLAAERSMLTATGMVMGSPGFMSPEQATGQREVGPPTDVFSLGAVLAYAATGSNPFGSGPTPALLYRVVNETPELDRGARRGRHGGALRGRGRGRNGAAAGIQAAVAAPLAVAGGRGGLGGHRHRDRSDPADAAHRGPGSPDQYHADRVARDHPEDLTDADGGQCEPAARAVIVPGLRPRDVQRRHDRRFLGNDTDLAHDAARVPAARPAAVADRGLVASGLTGHLRPGHLRPGRRDQSVHHRAVHPTDHPGLRRSGRLAPTPHEARVPLGQ